MANNRTNEALTTAYATNPGYDLGSVHENGYGDRFMFVKNVGSSSTVVGKLACWDTGGARGEVSMTVGDVATPGLSTTSKACGVWLSVVAQNEFGFMQISGRASVYTDDGVADKDFLVCDGGDTETFIADTAADGEEEAIFGQAMAADNDTTHLVTAIIWCQ